MRILTHVKFPAEPFNTYVKDGSAGARIQMIMAEAKPEAPYFAEFGGQRGGIIVVNLDDASKIPRSPSRGFSASMPTSNSTPP